MKRLKKLALVSASALMLMSASVSTIGAVNDNNSNNTVLAAKKKKKGLKLHWYKKAITKHLYHNPRQIWIYYSKFTKHPKWNAPKEVFSEISQTGDFLTSKNSMVYVGYVYINHHKYYIQNQMKHFTLENAPQKNRNDINELIRNDKYAYQPSLTVDRASDIDNYAKTYPVVYTSKNKPLHLYLKNESNNKTFATDSSNMWTDYLLPNTSFLVRKDIKPYTYKGNTYYVVLVPAKRIITKEGDSDNPDQFKYFGVADGEVNLKYPQQMNKITKYINKYNDVLHDMHHNSDKHFYCLYAVKNSDLQSMATKGGVYNTYNFPNYKNK